MNCNILPSKTLDEINLICRHHAVSSDVIWVKRPVASTSREAQRKCSEIEYQIRENTVIIVRVYVCPTYHDRYVMVRQDGKTYRLPAGDRFKYLRAELRQFIEEKIIPIASANFGSNPWFKGVKMKMKRQGVEHVNIEYLEGLKEHIQSLEVDPNTYWQSSLESDVPPAVFVKTDYDNDVVLIRMRRSDFGQPVIGFYINYVWYSPWKLGTEICCICNEIKQYLNRTWLAKADANDMKRISSAPNNAQS